MASTHTKILFFLFAVAKGADWKEIEEEKVICPDLESPRHGIVTCHYRGSRISCRDREIFAGTVADYECEKNFVADPIRIIECLEDGTWNSPIPVCVPDCGKQRSVVSLIMSGALVAPGMFPWHAAIYNFLDGRYEFWCGGSLISEFSVVTAAHCTWKVSTENLIVAFGKLMRDFHAVEKNAQKRKVVRVEMVGSYQDVGGNYNGDLSVIFLDRAIFINEIVKPICIDWNQKYMEDQLLNGNLGVVLGWGLTENDTYSDVVKSVQLPVESDENCIAQQHKDFRKFITYTSFCAGFRNGSGVCNGDSGGGLAFLEPKSDSWFLQGVVSVSPRRKGTFFCDPNFYTVFTKVSIFTKWLAKMKKLEEILIKSGIIF